MYDVLSIKIQDIISSEFNLHIEKKDEHKFIIREQGTSIFKQLSLIRGYETKKIKELIFVEAKHNKKRLEPLQKILREGFKYNDKHYVRFGKSNSQAKDGITVFIDREFFDEMMERSQLGVEIEKCTVSKYESYRCLIFSSVQFVEEKLPYIVLVDEYKKVLPNQYVRYAVEKENEYIDKETKQTKKGKLRSIEEGVRDIDLSPFDGFGVHTKEIGESFGKFITDKYVPIAYQIRLPFLKGMSVEAPFKEYYADRGIARIRDVFGKWHKVEDIDCIWNTSMWKSYGIFKGKFGNNAWNEYLRRINKYEYQIGISKYSHHRDNINLHSKMNFQYLQCLDLTNPTYVQQFKKRDYKYDILDVKNHGKVISAAKYSTNLVEKIIQGDKFYTLKFLGVKDSSSDSVNSKYVEAILVNDIMLKDPCIKNMLKRKLDKTITQMKYGKIYTDGFYHTVVGDIFGYLEYCAGLDIVGCLNAGEFHANTIPYGECLSFRSPLVDPSEVNKINIVKNELTEKYLSHFKDQDVCMINMYDLTMQQQGGMDEDGDSVMLCCDKVFIDSKINKPIVVDIEDKKSSGEVAYNMDSIINYECNSRDNRIGEITNIATSILNQFPEDEKWIKINEDNISLLRLFQGKEIDYVKTGFRWIISRNLRKYLKRLPHFILYNYPQKLNVYNKIKKINKGNESDDRIPYNSFKSPSAMNELCDYICQWERQNVTWDRSAVNNGSLLIDNKFDLSNRHIFKNIKTIYDDFKIEFQSLIAERDENSDFDVLYENYKKRLLEIELPYEHLANYCIKVAYRSISEDKLLCWTLFGDIIIKNLKFSSPKSIKSKIESSDRNEKNTYEFLGKYYKMTECN